MPKRVASRPPAAALARVASRLIEALERLQHRLLPAPAVLLKLTSGGMLVAQAIYVAAELGVADLLRSGPRPVAHLARATGTDAPSLYRVLRALASVGIFAETRPGVFRLTRLADSLRSDSPGSMRAWARYAGAEWQHEHWGAALACVRSGRSAYENVHGKSFFAWLAEHPEAGRRFDEAMTSLTAITTPAVVAGYDFSDIGTLFDVAGGRGSLLAAILADNPRLKGVLFDLPQVVADTRRDSPLNEPALAPRRALAGGSFFEEIPAGGDAYLLKSILHDWDDADAARILRNVRRAIPVGGRLLVVEVVLAPGNAPSVGKFLDLAMLTQTGGKERTGAEFRRLFAAASFDLARVSPTASPFSIIEGRPR